MKVLAKIDLNLGRKSKEVKVSKRLVKQKIPTVKEPKKRTAPPKIEKKLNRRNQREIARQKEYDEIEKKLNIKILRANETENLNSVFKLLAEEIKRKIPSSNVGIYEIGSGAKVKNIVGEPLSDIASERYFSLGETTVFVNPCGITDGNIYLNRLVTRFQIYRREYLLAVSCFAFEGLTKKSNIDEIIKVIQKAGGSI